MKQLFFWIHCLLRIHYIQNILSSIFNNYFFYNYFRNFTPFFYIFGQNVRYSSSLQSRDSEKIRNNLQKFPVLTKNTKNVNFWRFLLVFSVTIIFKEMGYFALLLSYQTQLLNIFLKIFTIRGDPSDLGGVKLSGKEKTGSKI